tara:strand:- start:421 stop:831 length:411 start_codon:yes stop_codon:yes gene_type:complete
MNVIVLVNDTFRRDHLGCYGNDWTHTPNLDQFGRRGAIFEQYYAASYPTVPNRWDLSTGWFGFPILGWQPLGQGDASWGQLLSYPTEAEAHASAYQENAPGSKRKVEAVTFGQVLEDNPRNLIRAFGQFYWAEDLV